MRLRLPLQLVGCVILAACSLVQANTGPKCNDCQFRVSVGESYFVDPNFGSPACAHPGSPDSDVEEWECPSDRCFTRYSPSSGVVARGCFTEEDGIDGDKEAFQVDKRGNRWLLCSRTNVHGSSPCNDEDVVARLNGHSGACLDHPTDEPYKAVNPPNTPQEGDGEEKDWYAMIGLNRGHKGPRVVINAKPIQPDPQPAPIVSSPPLKYPEPVEPSEIYVPEEPAVVPAAEEEPSDSEEKDWYRMIGLNRGHGKRRMRVMKRPQPKPDPVPVSVPKRAPIAKPAPVYHAPENVHTDGEGDWYKMIGINRSVDVARQAAAHRGSSSKPGRYISR